MGRYVLYSPVHAGPYSLLSQYHGNPYDYEAAYEELKEYAADLAEYPLTLIPEELPFPGHRSLKDLLFSMLLVSAIFA